MKLALLAAGVVVFAGLLLGLGGCISAPTVQFEFPVPAGFHTTV